MEVDFVELLVGYIDDPRCTAYIVYYTDHYSPTSAREFILADI